jgi:type I restriction enzyme S subunit
MTEGPYKLPEGWRWVRLGEIAWRESVTLKPSDYPDLVFRYLGMEHVAPGQWDEPMPVEIPGREIKSQVIVYRPGLILYGKLRPYLNKVVVPSTEGVASTEFVPIAVNEKVVESHYLAAYLRSPAFVAYATQNTTGSRQPRVRLDALWNALIPLPPLEEQRRIVARVEELMSRIREAKRLRQEAKEEAERLWQSILSETFPKPGTELPEGWRWVRLGEVFRLKNGKFIRAGELKSEGKVPVYGSNGLLGFTAIPLLMEGRTIVIGRVGACGAVNVVNAPCWISDNAMFVAEWFIECDIEYIALSLHNIDFSSFVKKGAQPSISQEVVYNAPIPLPPLEEQRRLVAYLQDVQEKIRNLKEVQAQTEAELKRLEQAILDKAFRGEL